MARNFGFGYKRGGYFGGTQGVRLHPATRNQILDQIAARLNAAGMGPKAAAPKAKASSRREAALKAWVTRRSRSKA